MMSTGFMATENADIPIGGSCAIFALGPVGSDVDRGRELRGAGLVIGVDSIPKRQELARYYAPTRSSITPGRCSRANHEAYEWRGR